MTMKIRTEDGTISFASGTITPRLGRKDFLHSPVASGAKEFLINEPFASYLIAPEMNIATTVQFAGDVLETVSILFEIPGESTDNWSEALELERKRIHDAWLRNELGPPPYTFGWGKITSDYDPRACESDILLAYGERRRSKS